MSASESIPSPTAAAPSAPAWPEAAAWPWVAARDAWERHLLFADVMRRRGNLFLEHQRAGEPALLQFAHELVLDGRSLPRPCCYSLVRILAPDVPEPDPCATPLVVVDPRAGHGPGIGGFKRDSEVGVALRAGHPVYFVTFRPEPEEGQTLFDVMAAEIRFLEEVVARHPQAKARPVVIGNCQAGWASSMLAAARPDLVGTLMVVGAPLSYWAGASTMNPMRYTGAMTGGSWMASLAADLAGGRFDGAHLVDNFERLNPANTWWSRYHKLWASIDDEAERFLAFERWWGGYFRMTTAEFETIVEQLFVGNKLARGEVRTDSGQALDLKAIQAPIVVFASWGDNITPPPQALNWIIDTWGDERAIAAAGRTIVYVLHDSIGHLGIFVGTDIARKEHDQIVTSIDVINHLPPGLYEMKLQDKDGAVPQRWDALEPGRYTAQFLHRTMDDLRAVNPEGRDEEQLFAKVAKLSDIQANAYKQWVRPWLQPWQGWLRFWGDAATAWHPLRLQRAGFSDAHPLAPWVARSAEAVRAQRQALPADHPARQGERMLSEGIESGLNLLRDLRDQSTIAASRWMFGPLGWGAVWPDGETDEARARREAEARLAQARDEWLPRLAEGGFAQAVCRIVLAGMVSIGSFERRSFRLAELLTELPNLGIAQPMPVQEWQQRLRQEAAMAAVAPVEALNALADMLPTADAREQALAVAAAVMMIEPQLANPRSEIIELLVQSLEVDPARVMALACALTKPLAAHAAATATAPAPAPGALTESLPPALSPSVWATTAAAGPGRPAPARARAASAVPVAAQAHAAPRPQRLGTGAARGKRAARGPA